MDFKLPDEILTLDSIVLVNSKPKTIRKIISLTDCVLVHEPWTELMYLEKTAGEDVCVRLYAAYDLEISKNYAAKKLEELVAEYAKPHARESRLGYMGAEMLEVQRKIDEELHRVMFQMEAILMKN
jgi:hypothetical protein